MMQKIVFVPFSCPIVLLAMEKLPTLLLVGVVKAEPVLWEVDWYVPQQQESVTLHQTVQIKTEITPIAMFVNVEKQRRVATATESLLASNAHQNSGSCVILIHAVDHLLVYTPMVMFPMQEHVDAGQSIAHQERDYFVIWKKVHAGAWQGKSKTIPLKRACRVHLDNTPHHHFHCGIAKPAQKVNTQIVSVLHHVAHVSLGPLPI